MKTMRMCSSSALWAVAMVASIASFSAAACSEDSPAVHATGTDGGKQKEKDAGSGAGGQPQEPDGSSGAPGDAAPEAAPLLPGRTVTIADGKVQSDIVGGSERFLKIPYAK